MTKASTLLSLAAICVLGALPSAAAGRDWPSWSGPDGDLTSLGNGVFDRRELGLETVWNRPLGPGFSGIAVVGQRLVTAFSDGDSDVLIALGTADGGELWRYRIAPTYRGHDGSDDGVIATPAIHDGIVYGLGPRGQLFALRLADGDQLWWRKIDEELGARPPSYGFSTAPTVVGDVLVVQTGGDGGRSISGLDRKTGELLWSTGDDPLAHQSPNVLTAGGDRQIVAVTDHQLLGLAPRTGEVLWRHRHSEKTGGFSQPVPVGEGGVLLTYWEEAALFRLRRHNGRSRVEEAWRGPALRGSYVIPVPFEGHLYGMSGRLLTCVDAASGETVWRSLAPGGRSLVLVDGHLVILTRDGHVVVAEATPAGYREKARLQALQRGHLTAPSFADGRIYVRNLSHLAAIQVIGEAPAEHDPSL